MLGLFCKTEIPYYVPFPMAAERPMIESVMSALLRLPRSHWQAYAPYEGGAVQAATPQRADFADTIKATPGRNTPQAEKHTPKHTPMMGGVHGGQETPDNVSFFASSSSIFSSLTNVFKKTV
jgi:hypothetical protein